MDWRKLMGAKPKDEHFDSYPEGPQKIGDQGVFTNIADNTDITDKHRKAKNVYEGVDQGFVEGDKPETEMEPSGPIPECDDFPHAHYEASLDWMAENPLCGMAGGLCRESPPEDRTEDGESPDDINPLTVAPVDDRNGGNSVACPVGHAEDYKMWRWKKGGPWVCTICHPFQGDKEKIEFYSPRAGK